MRLSTPLTFGRILVVDDNADAAELLQLFFTALGYEVEVAHSGQDGLAKARAFLPQVIFLDLGMPGMSGYEVAVELRKDRQLHDAFILALTGWNDQATRAAVIAAGFDRHLVKPGKLDEITRILAEYFSARLEDDAAADRPASPMDHV